MAARRKRGRPTKLTKENTAKLCEAIALGATYEIACAYAGITYRTFAKWMEFAERRPEDKRFASFLHAVKDAEAQGVIKWLRDVDVGFKNWQASAWKLERRYPQVYGRWSRTTVDGTTKQETKHTEEKNVNVNVGVHGNPAGQPPAITGQDAVDIVKILLDVGGLNAPLPGMADGRPQVPNNPRGLSIPELTAGPDESKPAGEPMAGSGGGQ